MNDFLKREDKEDWRLEREQACRQGAIFHISMDCIIIQGYTIEETISTIKQNYSFTIDEEIDLYLRLKNLFNKL